MTWVRFDDRYRRHRKVRPLSDTAFRLDVEGIMWSNDELTDGVVRPHELTQVLSNARPRHAAELVAHGRWHTAGTPCDSQSCPPSGPDGWVIHDYLDYQYSAAKVRADRAAKAERQRNWMAKRQASRQATNTSTGRASDAPADALLTPTPGPAPVPDPAPEGKREGDLPEAPAARRDAASRAADGRETEQDPDRLPPPPVNGPAADEARAAIRDRIAAARRARRGTPGEPVADPMAELRELTPEIAPLLEETAADETPPAPSGDDPGGGS